MGLCGSSKTDEFESFRESEGDVKLLIAALNYEYVEGAQLTCTKDGRTMLRLARRAGVSDITVLHDKYGPGRKYFPTRSVVFKQLKEVASRCEPGDWFVFFWAGHGINVPDYNGDEASGLDQAFVTPDPGGRLVESAVLIDDEFALALDTFVPDGVRILVICDCCHSGTICDIDSFRYKHEIYQISASQDNEEAEDIGFGGVLTVALRRAVRQLSLQYGSQEFSIQDVVDLCTSYAEGLTKEQELSFQYSGTHPEAVAWPLCYSPMKLIIHPRLVVPSALGGKSIYEYELDSDSDGNDL